MENNERIPPPPPPPLPLHWFGNQHQPRTQLTLPTTFPITIIVFTPTMSLLITLTNESITVNTNRSLLHPFPDRNGHRIFGLTFPTGLTLPTIITITTNTFIHFLVHPSGAIYNITPFVNTTIMVLLFFFFFHLSHQAPLLLPPPPHNGQQHTTDQAITIPITLTLNLSNTDTNTFIAVPIYICTDFIIISAHNIIGTTDWEAFVWFSDPTIRRHP